MSQSTTRTAAVIRHRNSRFAVATPPPLAGIRGVGGWPGPKNNAPDMRQDSGPEVTFPATARERAPPTDSHV